MPLLRATAQLGRLATRHVQGHDIHMAASTVLPLQTDSRHEKNTRVATQHKATATETAISIRQGRLGRNVRSIYGVIALHFCCPSCTPSATGKPIVTAAVLDKTYGTCM